MYIFGRKDTYLRIWYLFANLKFKVQLTEVKDIKYILEQQINKPFSKVKKTPQLKLCGIEIDADKTYMLNNSLFIYMNVN